MIALALRNMVSHKARTAATALSIAMGVAFLAGTLVLADTVRAALDGTFAQAYGGTDAYVRAPAPLGMGHVDSRRPRLDGVLVEQVRGVPGVAGAEGRVEGYAQLLDRARKPVASPGESFGASWSTLDSANPFRLVAGRAPAAATEAVIDRKSANAAGYRVGDRARVATRTGTHDITVVGIAAFGDADSPAGSSYVLLMHDAAQRLVAQPGRVDGITVVGEAGVSSDDLRDRIAAELGDGVEVLTSDELVRESGGITKDVTTSIRKLLLAFAALALGVSAFLVNNTFSILVAQRTREVALLRLVGSTRRQVLRLVMGEAAVLGAVGAAAGALMGIGVAAGLRPLVAGLGFDIPSGPLVVRASSVLAPMVVGAVVTMAAVLLPARRAGAVAPVAALRGAETDETARPRGRKLVAAALLGLGSALVVLPVLTGAQQPAVIGLGAALVFLGLAVVGPLLAPPIVRLIGAPAARWAGASAGLARQTAARNSRRTAGAASALMIGVGMVTLISVFAASAKATVSRPFSAGQDAAASPDFVILSADPGSPGFSPDLARRLEGLPQLATVASARTGMVQVGSEPLHVHAVDPARWGTMVDYGDQTPLAVDEVSVITMAARIKGWTVGTILTIRFPETGERQFRIAAMRTSGPPLLLTQAAYQANAAEQLDTAVLVKKADSATREEAASAIRAVMQDYPAATLLDERGKSAEQLATIDQFANTVYVLLALAVLIALIGIATTLALSVVEQTRDLGLLRAVGMTPRQVRAMVRWESLLIVWLGCAIGVSAGLFFGWAILRSFPDDVAFRIPAVQIAAVVSASALAAMAAAAGPARRASRIDVLIAVARP